MGTIGLFLLLLNIVIGLFLGFWVFLADRKSSTAKSYFAISIFILFWNLFGYLSYEINDRTYSLLYTRLNLAAVALFLLSFYYFAIFFPTGDKRRFAILDYVITIIGISFAFIASVSNLVIDNVYLTGDSQITMEMGHLGNLFYSWAIVVTLWGLFRMIRKYWALDQLNKRKVQFFLIGTFLFAFFNILFNIILFYVSPQNAKFTQLGDFSAIFFLGFTAYAVMKHQLFDIKVIATEATVIVLSLALCVEIFISNSISEGLIKAVIWVLATYGGYILVKSVKVEIKQRSDLEKLTKKLEESNSELETANKELEKLDKMKDEFISVASHELNTPLAAIEGYLSMILDEKMAKVDTKAQEYLKRAYQSSKRLAALITDLLNVSRIEQGRIHLQYELADVAKEAKEAVDELTIKAQEKKIELELEKMPKDLPKTWFDSGRIHEVLVNLIGNAIKFTDNGGVYVSGKKTDDGVQISVRDTGIGIAKENAERLFHKFSQINRAQEERQGTGLGLYISKNYVELHNGKIWAESEGEGKGTTISFLLPILKEKPFDSHEGEGAVLRSKPSDEVLNQVMEISKRHAIKE